MSWQYAYRTACDNNKMDPRPEIVDTSEMASLILNGNCDQRFNSRVTDAEVATLCEAISAVPSVTEIDLSYNKISDEGAVCFAEMIKKNSSIQFVTLAHNDIGTEGARAIADALMLNMSIVSLSLRCNPIGDEGGIAIGTMLRGNNTLVALDLHNCGLLTKALVSIAQALITHPVLSSLNIDKPQIKGPHDIQYVLQHLAAMISRTTVLVELSMNHFGLYDDHLGSILHAFVQNNTITTLSLAGNKLTQDGGVMLGTFLSRRPDVVTLDVSSNHLDDRGATALAAVVRQHPTLQNLYLGNNAIGEAGLLAVADAMQASPGLKNLLLWGNKFTENAAAQFYKYRKRIAQLDYLDFEMYVVDDVVMISQTQ